MVIVVCVFCVASFFIAYFILFLSRKSSFGAIIKSNLWRIFSLILFTCRIQDSNEVWKTWSSYLKTSLDLDSGPMSFLQQAGIKVSRYQPEPSFLAFLLFYSYFSRFFENLNSIFWKNYIPRYPFPQVTRGNFLSFSDFSYHYQHMVIIGKIR